MSENRLEKLRTEELLVVRDLLKRQNGLLGYSVSQLDHLLYLQKNINLLNSSEIDKILSEKLPYILSIHYFSLFLYDKNTKLLHLTSHNRPDLEEHFSLHQSDSAIMERAITQGKYILEKDFPRSHFKKDQSNPLFKCKFFVTIPLRIQNEIIGVLNLNDNDNGFFSVGDLDFALNVSEFISLAISNARSYEKAEKLSITDGLTGLINHQQILVLLKKEVQRSLRYHPPLSLIIIDVDHFKPINDTYGHLKGDEVLIQLSSILERLCRTHDLAGRYGGDEFILILPETKIDGAVKIAERLREQILRTSGDDGFGVTVSGGVSEFDPESMKEASELVEAADKALYQAKDRGGNQIARSK